MLLTADLESSNKWDCKKTIISWASAIFHFTSRSCLNIWAGCGQITVILRSLLSHWSWARCHHVSSSLVSSNCFFSVKQQAASYAKLNWTKTFFYFFSVFFPCREFFSHFLPDHKPYKSPLKRQMEIGLYIINPNVFYRMWRYQFSAYDWIFLLVFIICNGNKICNDLQVYSLTKLRVL